jgi:HTH-type transcriptional regulator/antitoxin HigA
MKAIRPLRTEADYEAALQAIAKYFENQPKPGTPEGDRFDMLALVIGDYEDKHYPIEAPEPVEAIKIAMERKGYSQADLGRVIGSASRASEILNRRRYLTVDMIWALNKKWGIPAESLIKPYRIRKVAKPPKRARASR